MSMQSQPVLSYGSAFSPAVSTDPAASWFALTLKPQRERVVAEALASKGLQPFLPTYRARRVWSDRIKELELPLFPRYLFCRFPTPARAKVLATPGVRSVVSFGGLPAPIPDSEIAALETMLNSGASLQPWPFLKVGQRVRVERGPLRGLEGILVRQRDDFRIIVSVEMLQRSVAAELETYAVSPL